MFIHSHKKYTVRSMMLINPYNFKIADVDASLFIAAANISDALIESAIGTLVMNLKSAGIWNKMKALYPFVGGNAFSHKLNLKDPRDADEAFRLSYIIDGSITHTSDGIQFIDASVNSHITPSATLSLNSTHVSVYRRTFFGGAARPVFGVTAGGSEINIYSNFGGEMYCRVNDSSGPIKLATASYGLFMANRKLSNTGEMWLNLTKYLNSSNSGSRPNAPIIFSGQYNGGTIYKASETFSFASVGDGLTDLEVTNFYNILQTFQTTLGRQL